MAAYAIGSKTSDEMGIIQIKGTIGCLSLNVLSAARQKRFGMQIVIAAVTKTATIAKARDTLKAFCVAGLAD
jgi:hypothetical protein